VFDESYRCDAGPGLLGSDSSRLPPSWESSPRLFHQRPWGSYSLGSGLWSWSGRASSVARGANASSTTRLVTAQHSGSPGADRAGAVVFHCTLGCRPIVRRSGIMETHLRTDDQQMTDYSVGIVVDREFGDRVVPLSRRLHVWVCDSPANRAATMSVREEQPSHSPTSGVTIFDSRHGDSPEEMFLKIVETVDLHHGEWGHEPAWTAMEVYGVGPTAAIRSALEEYGVTEFIQSPEGFIARRPQPDVGELHDPTN
jgi:hypothetical protein